MTNTVHIIADQHPQNPRTESYTQSLMACAHGRYSLGDTNARQVMLQKLARFGDFSDRSLADLVSLVHDKNLVLASSPLYLYDHSGITMSTTPFSCPWDSGTVGCIMVFADDMKREEGVKRMGKHIRQRLEEQAQKIIESEVKVYDQYLTGDVYGFEIRDENGDVKDSGWGFYGSDVRKNGILDSIDADLHESALAAEITY